MGYRQTFSCLVNFLESQSKNPSVWFSAIHLWSPWKKKLVSSSLRFWEILITMKLIGWNANFEERAITALEDVSKFYCVVLNVASDPLQLHAVAEKPKLSRFLVIAITRKTPKWSIFRLYPTLKLLDGILVLICKDRFNTHI